MKKDGAEQYICTNILCMETSRTTMVIALKIFFFIIGASLRDLDGISFFLSMRSGSPASPAVAL
jgi:hypothetical protein